MSRATQQRNSKVFLLCCQVLSLLYLHLVMGTYANAEGPRSRPEEDSHWTALAGYGVTHTSIGNTRAHVETVDFILRHTRYLTAEKGGSWYRCRHALMLEAPMHVVVDPETSPMFGVNVLASWTFTASEELRPYFFGGGGFLYTEADIPGLGSRYNGNYQGGAGILYRIHPSYLLSAEYRFHHVSNLDTETPNAPLNSSKFLVGMTVLF